jgi:hypothetical protein
MKDQNINKSPKRNPKAAFSDRNAEAIRKSQQSEVTSKIVQDLAYELNVLEGHIEISNGPSPEEIAEREFRNTPTDENVEQLLIEMDERNLDRLFMPLHTAAMCIKALQLMSKLPPAETQCRVAEEYWRSLAQKTIEVFFKPLRGELDMQDRIREMPEKEGKGINVVCDSSGGLGIFLDAAREAPELHDFEPDYFRRGLKESTGKAEWTGPYFWRDKQAAKVDGPHSPLNKSVNK